GHFPVQRHMSVPVLDSGRIVAVAGVGNKEQPYNESDVRQLQLLMNEMWQLFKHKRAEQEMHDLQAQLLQSQKMEAMGRLAGGIAHDFNNMLSVILGYSELNMAMLQDDDPLLHNLRMIEKAAEHSRDITRQLLAFSRKQISEPKIIDLNDSVAQMQKTLARLIGEDIELRFSPGEDLCKVKIDPSQLDQILVNLAVNARDAMPKGGRLTVQTRNVKLIEIDTRNLVGIKADEYVLLEVSDNGTGMEKETLSHIFEPFFTTKETGKGTGLGLATVYGIVHQNQGCINVYSEPGKGTTFKIYLPRVEMEHEVQAAHVTVPSYHGKGTILLVEDDAMVREMIATMLAKIGFTVLKSENPSGALALSENKNISFDLLLTDVVMPGMSGRELYERIEAVRRGMKVLYMSGYASEVIAHSGILEEGVHFIQKPFNEKELARKICETLSREADASAESRETENA
ncbi:MAG: ATP-binding protein, partial [Nitrospirota bacterium]|nr:ATP-binding protein [Nitrospirota bacterium]